MSTPIPFDSIDPIPASQFRNVKEFISTKPARKLSYKARIQLFFDGAHSRLGPLLVAFALLIMAQIFLCHFLVFIPFHFHLQLGDSTKDSTNLSYHLTLIWSLYLLWGTVANYYYCIATPPGSPLDDISDESEGASFQDVLLEMEAYTVFPATCKRCHIPKPERAHHCSICKKCILKYDHHCPWINNCIGHFNHRYFVMFLTFVSVTSAYLFYTGIKPFMYLMEYTNNGNWPFMYPVPLLILTMLFLGTLALAVGGMCCWHWYLTLTAQTTLEKYDNSYMKKACKAKGEKFTNMYDFGIIGNLLFFFNVGRRGHYPWYTVLLPIRIPPIGNGKRFEKSGHGYVLEFSEDEDEYEE